MIESQKRTVLMEFELCPLKSHLDTASLWKLFISQNCRASLQLKT
jgi:hypothetical protein